MATKNERECGLSCDALKARFRYDSESGKLFYRCDVPAAHRRAGEEAGCAKGGAAGYLIVSINGKHIYVHRLAWLLTHGCWPDHCLDHIDCNRQNNRIGNLRQATDIQNRPNTKTRARSGLKGVLIPKHAPNSFTAQITVNGKNKYLGCFSTPEAAHAAYVKAAHEAFGEFARAA